MLTVGVSHVRYVCCVSVHTCSMCIRVCVYCRRGIGDRPSRFAVSWRFTWLGRRALAPAMPGKLGGSAGLPRGGSQHEQLVSGTAPGPGACAPRTHDRRPLQVRVRGCGRRAGGLREGPSCGGPAEAVCPAERLPVVTGRRSVPHRGLLTPATGASRGRLPCVGLSPPPGMRGQAAPCSRPPPSDPDLPRQNHLSGRQTVTLARSHAACQSLAKFLS